jgi:hypothetical protein
MSYGGDGDSQHEGGGGYGMIRHKPTDINLYSEEQKRANWAQRKSQYSNHALSRGSQYSNHALSRGSQYSNHALSRGSQYSNRALSREIHYDGYMVRYLKKLNNLKSHLNIVSMFGNFISGHKFQRRFPASAGHEFMFC